ncbi:hypothetical protein PV10_08370 [Exophiala mesophila]|uniref:Methyltransferase domain-containing protein n=1 Tax=Exophiala mesophila TaxID=212818 RepID=A0A0D1Z1R6_EXOME|nr:uncharacterized protein PV10_08370 [Exophiala mesophila]KIV88712.1 hypothetical protein PV10_08370 [Exophiala mesophila]
MADSPEKEIVPEEQPQPPALEADVNDNDSALGDEGDLTSTASLTSSIYHYRQENGRTYNSFGDAYILPNDEAELDRLDLQHHLMKLTFGDRLTTVNFEEGKELQRVLDVGTGTGIWAIEFADLHPEALITGVDLSPTQPPFVPPNVSFEIVDITKPWSFSYTFDFIFARMMTGAFGDWKAFIQETYDNLNPGGVIEIQDVHFDVGSSDGSLPEDSALRMWSKYMLEASRTLGVPLDSVLSVKAQLIEAGFEDVQQTVQLWPMTWWPKDPRHKKIGLWTYHNMSGNLLGISVAFFTRGLGWTVEELEVFLAKVRTDMKNTQFHAVWPIYAVSGRKPKA